MRTTTKRRLAGIFAVMGVAFVILNVLAYNHAYSMMHFTRGGVRTAKPEKLTLCQRARVLLIGVKVPRPESMLQPADLAPDCRRLSIRTPDGVTLGGWYVDHGAETPLVILFHGYGGEKTGLLREARTFLRLGTSVLLVDFRGSGESSESYATIGVREADDVAAAVRLARETLHHTALILYGQSMGSAAILRAVDKNGIQPDGVIIEAVFDSMLNTVRHRFESMGVPSFPNAELLVFWGGVQIGCNAFAHNPVTYAKALTCPALFMHGSDDPRARLEDGRRVFDAVPGVKTFKEFHATGHESYLSRDPVAWTATVRAFLESEEP